VRWSNGRATKSCTAQQIDGRGVVWGAPHQCSRSRFGRGSEGVVVGTNSARSTAFKLFSITNRNEKVKTDILSGGRIVQVNGTTLENTLA
jgi:hypothetical protein